MCKYRVTVEDFCKRDSPVKSGVIELEHPLHTTPSQWQLEIRPITSSLVQIKVVRLNSTMLQHQQDVVALLRVTVKTAGYCPDAVSVDLQVPNEVRCEVVREPAKEGEAEVIEGELVCLRDGEEDNTSRCTREKHINFGSVEEHHYVQQEPRQPSLKRLARVVQGLIGDYGKAIEHSSIMPTQGF